MGRWTQDTTRARFVGWMAGMRALHLSSKRAWRVGPASRAGLEPFDTRRLLTTARPEIPCLAGRARVRTSREVDSLVRGPSHEDGDWRLDPRLGWIGFGARPNARGKE